MPVRPARKGRQVGARKAGKVAKEGVVRARVDARHAVPPAEHRVAAHQKGHEEDVGILRLGIVAAEALVVAFSQGFLWCFAWLVGTRALAEFWSELERGRGFDRLPANPDPHHCGRTLAANPEPAPHYRDRTATSTG